ncbi:hypothetical protein BDV12DRAFT_181215 [Aspergillus spectabilis]
MVLLTSSTGTLCTYLLHALLQNPSITHIHCLNRKPNSAALKQAQAAKLHLLVSLDRVSFHTSDLTHPTLGPPNSTLTTLLNTATIILHSAWPVTWTLNHFNPVLQGTVNLLNLTATAPLSPRFVFPFDHRRRHPCPLQFHSRSAHRNALFRRHWLLHKQIPGRTPRRQRPPWLRRRHHPRLPLAGGANTNGRPPNGSPV